MQRVVDLELLKHAKEADDSMARSFLETHRGAIEHLCTKYAAVGEAEGGADAGEEKEEGSSANTHIGMDGVMQFFEDLKVELDDVRCLLVAWYFHAEAMGEFTKTEFTLGMARLKCVSMDQLVARLPSLQVRRERRDIHTVCCAAVLLCCCAAVLLCCCAAVLLCAVCYC